VTGVVAVGWLDDVEEHAVVERELQRAGERVADHEPWGEGRSFGA
jgi:hypothetical protein